MPRCRRFSGSQRRFCSIKSMGFIFRSGRCFTGNKNFKKSAKGFLWNIRILLPCVIIDGYMLNAYDRSAGRLVTGGGIALGPLGPKRPRAGALPDASRRRGGPCGRPADGSPIHAHPNFMFIHHCFLGFQGYSRLFKIEFFFRPPSVPSVSPVPFIPATGQARARVDSPWCGG